MCMERAKGSKRRLIKIEFIKINIKYSLNFHNAAFHAFAFYNAVACAVVVIQNAVLEALFLHSTAA